MVTVVVSLSNFSGKGPVKVGTAPNSGEFEVFDLAGNVRECCWIELAAGRAIRGGAWDDHTYMLSSITQAPPFERSARTGFRCMRQADPALAPAKLFAPIPRARVVRDYSKETPVSEAVFAAYRQQYAYDPIPLDARTEALVMFAARREHLVQVIEPALAAGRWVVSDRFSDATFAYQCGGRGLEREVFAALEALVHPGLEPDATFLFDIDLSAQTFPCPFDDGPQISKSRRPNCDGSAMNRAARPHPTIEYPAEVHQECNSAPARR